MAQQGRRVKQTAVKLFVAKARNSYARSAEEPWALPTLQKTKTKYAAVAQSVEHILGKDEVGGSSPLSSSKKGVTKWLHLFYNCCIF